MKRHYHFLTAITLLIYLLAGCVSKEQPDFSKYISGYTDGMIKSSAAVSIYLAIKPDKGFQSGTTLPENILKITPSIKGELVLKENNCIEFTPSERFKSGTTYEAVFDLGALCDVPSQYRKFNFKFEIMPFKVIFKEGNIKTDNSNDSTLIYEASLISSDYMSPEDAEKKLKITFDGQEIIPEWSHEGETHQFTIRNLYKGTEQKSLILSFSKDVNDGNKVEINIPGQDDFTVLNVTSSDSESPVISVYMSEKINPAQDLNGLISITGYSSFNYKINGNIIYLYPSQDKQGGVLNLEVHPGIKSITGNTLKTEFIRSIRLTSSKPEVRLIGKGVIVPGDDKVLIPFSAVALKAVDLEIVEVLNQNMNFFFQENDYNGYSELSRTARPIFMKKIDLEKDHPGIDLNRWNDFTINLGELVKLEKGTIYRIRLKFKKSYTTLECANEIPDSEYKNTDWDNPNFYYSEYSYPAGYEWEERENPCHVSYYIGDRFAGRNIINTSLGLLAKKGEDNRYFVCVTDLSTAAPITDCEVYLYNYQNQKIDSARTDKNGFVSLRPEGKAFIVQATKGNDRAWLRIADGNALSLSNFDVSGQHVQMGIKGFIYGERGVWRPGDNIYLSLILEDKMQLLPDGHPIVAQLIDPKGNILQSRKGSVGGNNIHCFTFKTDESAPTGYWKAVFRVGGLTFTQTIRVETVKANRLAINMHFPNEKVIGEGVSTAPVKVSTKWLNGAKTSNQKAITEVRLYNTNAGFSEYPDYTFSDRSKYFEPNQETLFDGKTDSEGSFSFSLGKIKADNAPGLLNAAFTTRLFENGGDFSISTQSIKYSPYKEYVGLRLPKSDDNWYSTQRPLQLNGVTITPTGQKSGNATIDINVYRINWHWWWDSEDENASNFVNKNYSKHVLSRQVKATNGTFSAELNITEYGRYFIHATDPSGHSTGVIAYFGSWSDVKNDNTATMLQLSTDKKSYKTGEKIKLTIPTSAGSVAIVSLENGKAITKIFRVNGQESSTTVELDASTEMCPNIYIGVTLIQPNNRKNDRPMRLYGVINVNVEDNGLHLEPEIQVAKELRPTKDFNVTVKEKNGKGMNYTIAIVDEGLLSLTTFRTPDPFSSFYAREALGVKTWDLYDYIYGAYGARLDKAFAVGGDEALKNIQDEKNNRFKPVVIFEGPFTLKAGGSQTHTFRMPDYIGEVRTMVVAASSKGQYGSAASSSTVNKPLMISVAMPRLFTPGDIIDIPVTVFAMKDNIRDVTVKISSDNKITLEGNTTQNIQFSEKGEKVVYFKARINAQTGLSTITTEAVAGNESAVVTENTTIRIPNPRITQIEGKVLKGNESISFAATINGAEPISTLEISSIPPLNLEQRLSYLLQYPHGCVEQIASQAFPQLSLSYLLNLTPEEQVKAENNIKEVISHLRRYQTSEGGFAYWEGSSYVSEWASTYVVQFLTSAQQKGYSVPVQMYQNAVSYLKKVANSWNITEPWSQMQQAYRLYVLAYAGRADLPAMNRLRETNLKHVTSQWLLASAYVLTNRTETAQKLVSQLSQDVQPYRQTGGNYGSDTRDYALILQSLVTLDMQQDAYRMLEKISQSMGSGQWYSTQETAFALHAAAMYVEKYLGSQNGINVIVTTPAGKQNVKIEKTVYQQNLDIKNQKVSVEIKNNGQGNLNARLINSSAPMEVVTEKIMSGLSMEVRYFSDNGTQINIHDLQQGQDVIAEISLKNTGVTGTYNELALSYFIPSGFEIINERLTGNTSSLAGAENIDIRDDRFYVYFSLEQNQAKTFRFRCNASFRGEYMLPAISCSAMYDNSIRAVWPGGKVIIK